MSYTAINGMRSHRFPFMGLGNCACGMGETPSTAEKVVIAVSVGGLLFGITSILKRAVRPNRRRRHRR